MWYRLKFKLTNPLPTGAMIQIKVPDSMTLTIKDVLGKPSSYYVESGLEDISNESPLSLTSAIVLGSRLITIKNFQPQSQPDSIAIVMLLTLPSSNGPSLPFEMRSYTDDTATFEIDKDVATARIDVSSTSIPTAHTLTSSVTQADGTSYSDLTFTITPDKSIDAFGSFKLLLDERLVTVGVDNSSCKVWLKSTLVFVDSPNCIKRDRDVNIKLSNGPYTLGISSTFKLNGIIRSPELAGDYYIEVQSLSPTGSILESYTEVLSFTATSL